MSDAHLDAWARSLREGRTDALRPLVEALTRALIAVAYRYVGDWETARDLTQETWIRVHGSVHRWDPSRPVRPWILAIHRNSCLDHLRRRRPEPVVDDRWSEQVQDPRSDPLEIAAHLELRQRIRTALDLLSEAQRRVLVMVDLEEMRPAEVAAQTGMNPTTVRTTLHFARRRLARLLGREET